MASSEFAQAALSLLTQTRIPDGWFARMIVDNDPIGAHQTPEHSLSVISSRCSLLVYLNGPELAIYVYQTFPVRAHLFHIQIADPRYPEIFWERARALTEA